MTRTATPVLTMVLLSCLTIAHAETAPPPETIPLEDVAYLRVANPLLEKQLLVERFQRAQEVTVAEVEKRDAELTAAIARVAADAGGGTSQYTLDLANRRLVLVPTTTSTSTTVSSTTTTSSTTTSTVPGG